MLIPNPIYAYIAAGSLLLGITAGYKVRDWQCDAAQAKVLQESALQKAKMEGKVNAIAQVYEQERDQAYGLAATRSNTIREVYKFTPASPSSCAAPVAIVGMLQSGVDSANASTASKSGK